VWAAGVESVGAPVARVRVLGATSLLGEVTVGGAAGVGVCARGATSPSSGVTAGSGSARCFNAVT
jgi:hypothetical protein